jgi:hypothetical protein
MHPGGAEQTVVHDRPGGRRRALTAAVVIGLTALVACGGSGSGEAGTEPTELPATTESATTEPATTEPATTEPATTEPATTASSVVDDEPQPYLGPLTFDWPTGCSVAVTEAIDVENDLVELAYDLELTASADDDGLIVSFADMRVVRQAGSTIPDQVQAELGRLYVLPAFVVRPDGSVTELVDFDAYLEQVLDLLDLDAVPDALAAATEERIIGIYWDTWAGVWATTGPVLDPVTELIGDHPVGDQVVSTRVRLDSRPVTSEGTASLRLQENLDGEDLLIAFGAITDAAGNNPTGTIDEGYRVTVKEVVTDPATLRPTSARFEMQIALVVDGRAESSLEVRTWTMDWSACDAL